MPPPTAPEAGRCTSRPVMRSTISSSDAPTMRFAIDAAEHGPRGRQRGCGPAGRDARLAHRSRSPGPRAAATRAPAPPRTVGGGPARPSVALRPRRRPRAAAPGLREERPTVGAPSCELIRTRAPRPAHVTRSTRHARAWTSSAPRCARMTRSTVSVAPAAHAACALCAAQRATVSSALLGRRLDRTVLGRHKVQQLERRDRNRRVAFVGSQGGDAGRHGAGGPHGRLRLGCSLEARGAGHCAAEQRTSARPPAATHQSRRSC